MKKFKILDLEKIIDKNTSKVDGKAPANLLAQGDTSKIDGKTPAYKPASIRAKLMAKRQPFGQRLLDASFDDK